MTLPTPPKDDQQPTRDWHGMPITIGLLVSLVLATLWGIDQMHSHEDRNRRDMRAIVDAHNDSDQSHPGIRKALRDMEGRMTKRVERIGDNVNELRSDVKKLLQQPLRRRRR